MAVSTTTKKYKNLARLFFLLSTLATLAPLLVYGGIGFASQEVGTANKVVLGFSLIMGIILTTYGALTKVSFRCVSFIMLLGLVLCVQQLFTMIIVLCVCNVVDELVFVPLYKRYKNLATINGEIDKRV